MGKQQPKDKLANCPLATIDEDSFCLVVAKWDTSNLIATEKAFPDLLNRINLAFKNAKKFELKSESDIELTLTLLRCGPKLETILINDDTLSKLTEWDEVGILTVEEVAQFFPNIKSFGAVQKQYLKYLADYAENLDGDCKLDLFELYVDEECQPHNQRLLKKCNSIETINYNPRPFEPIIHLEIANKYLREYLLKPTAAKLRKFSVECIHFTELRFLEKLCDVLEPACKLLIKYEISWIEPAVEVERAFRNIQTNKQLDKRVTLLLPLRFLPSFSGPVISVLEPIALPIVKELALIGVGEVNLQRLTVFTSVETISIDDAYDSLWPLLINRGNFKQLKTLRVYRSRCGPLFLEFLRTRAEVLDKTGSFLVEDNVADILTEFAANKTIKVDKYMIFLTRVKDNNLSEGLKMLREELAARNIEVICSQNLDKHLLKKLMSLNTGLSCY